VPTPGTGVDVQELGLLGLRIAFEFDFNQPCIGNGRKQLAGWLLNRRFVHCLDKAAAVSAKVDRMLPNPTGNKPSQGLAIRTQCRE
jgi:hypothetical protein